MKEKDVFTFLAAGAHIGGANLTSKWNSTSIKGKVMASTSFLPGREPGRNFCSQLKPLLPWKTQLMSVVTSSRTTGQGAVLNFTAATGSTPTVGRFTPGTLTNEISPSRSRNFWWLPIPGLSSSLSAQTPYVNLPTTALYDTDSPLCNADPAIPCNIREIAQQIWCAECRPGSLVPCLALSPLNHLWVVMPDVYFHGDPEVVEKEEQAAAEKARTKEEFQGEWTVPAPWFTATQPKVTDWSDAAGALWACPLLQPAAFGLP
ncbi:40S ribosomal protein SA-like [Neomonachus schauinslandi]|uniref:40S ribosomal protein SA n=1 Tax=Neomonachus schauinslandi TaxID=29088 RepID=A0A2Y9G6T0_NEOSC|nr:40S ribosomal protein SA-like [Neomonachus schauinslandi]